MVPSSALENRETVKKTIIPAAVVLTVVFLLYFLPFASPSPRLWGVSHLLFLPAVFLYVFICGAALVLGALFIKPLRNILLVVYESVAGFLMHDYSAWRWIATAFVCGAIFYLVRLPIYLLGDSYWAVNNVGEEFPAVYKWSEMGAIFLADQIAELMPGSGAARGINAYVVISLISGVVSVFLMGALAFKLFEKSGERLLVFVLMLTGGWLVLFCGYTENYSSLWPFAMGYLYFGVRFIKLGRGLVFAALFLIAGILIHLQMIFFGLSFLYLIWHGLNQKGISEGGLKTARLVLSSLLAVCGITFLLLYFFSEEMHYYIIPLLPGHGRYPWPDYWFLSLTHLVDIANLFLLMIPAGLLLVFFVSRTRICDSDGINRFLLYFSAAGILFLFLIEPKLGMGRDWDLFALTCLGPLLVLVRSVSDRIKLIRPVLALVAVVLIFPYVAVNARIDSSVKRVEYLLNMDMPRSRSGITIMKIMADNLGQRARADSLNGVLAENFPVATMIPRATDLYNAGRFEEALNVVDSVFLMDPFSLEALNMKGRILTRIGRLDEGIDMLEKAAQRGRYHSRIINNLAQAYFQAGRYEDMFNRLRQAQDLRPDDTIIVEGLAVAFAALDQFDSSLVYAEKLIGLYPDFIEGYRMAGLAAYNLRLDDKARQYLRYYIQYAPDNIRRKTAVEVYMRLVSEETDDESKK